MEFYNNVIIKLWAYRIIREHHVFFTCPWDSAFPPLLTLIENYSSKNSTTSDSQVLLWNRALSGIGHNYFKNHINFVIKWKQNIGGRHLIQLGFLSQRWVVLQCLINSIRLSTCYIQPGAKENEKEREREVQHRSSFPCNVQPGDGSIWKLSQALWCAQEEFITQGRQDYNQSLKKIQNCSITNAVILYCTGEGKNNYLSRRNINPRGHIWVGRIRTSRILLLKRVGKEFETEETPRAKAKRYNRIWCVQIRLDIPAWGNHSLYIGSRLLKGNHD